MNGPRILLVLDIGSNPPSKTIHHNLFRSVRPFKLFAIVAQAASK